MGQGIAYRNSTNALTLTLSIRQSLPPRRDKLLKNLQANVLQRSVSCVKTKERSTDLGLLKGRSFKDVRYPRPGVWMVLKLSEDLLGDLLLKRTIRLAISAQNRVDRREETYICASASVECPDNVVKNTDIQVLREIQ